MTTSPKDAIAEFVATVPQQSPAEHSCSMWERYGTEWARFVPTDPSAEDDSYDLLRHYLSTWAGSTEAHNRPNAVVFVSGGWALPVASMEGTRRDTPPSQHPDRLRVTVSICVTVFGQASHARIMHPSGDEEMISDDLGQPGGPLAEVMDTVAMSVFGSEYSARLLLEFLDKRDTLTEGERASMMERIASLRDHAEAIIDALDQGDTTESATARSASEALARDLLPGSPDLN